MRARYKIGMLIKTKETDEVGSTTAVIEGVLTTARGIEYILADKNATRISEDEIESAFREYKFRPRNASPVKRNKKNVAKAA